MPTIVPRVTEVGSGPSHSPASIFSRISFRASVSALTRSQFSCVCRRSSNSAARASTSASCAADSSRRWSGMDASRASFPASSPRKTPVPT